MNKHITVLSALLIVQLVITGLLFSADSEFEKVSSKPMLSLNNKELASIDIKDSDGELKFIRQNGQWQLDGFSKFPLQTSKLSLLTQLLPATKVTWPVTTTTSSHQRFKVAKDNFEKQLIYTDTQGQAQTLLLGSSPSFKQLYARNPETDEVFTIEASSYQLATSANDWLDKSLLALDNITHIVHADLNLVKQDDSWQLTAPSAIEESKMLDTEGIEAFISQLAKVTVSEIDQGTYQATDTLAVQDQQNNHYTYYFASDEDHYVVKRNDYPYWFSLPKAKYEQLSKVSLAQFVIDKPETEEPATTDLSE